MQAFNFQQVETFSLKTIFRNATQRKHFWQSLIHQNW